MISLGWLVFLLGILSLGTLFFAVNAITLRILSRAKLQESFKEAGKKDLSEDIVENSEKLTLTCSFYRVIINMLILLLMLNFFKIVALWWVALLISIAIVFVFGLVIPHAWAKYAGEKLLSRTYRFLTLLSVVTSPILYIWKFVDSLIRRLAGVAETTAEEQQEEKQEEFLTDLEQHKMEGAVDEEEQEMIENVLELSETTADEIMTPRTDIIAVEVDSPLQPILDAINSAGHSRLPVYKKNIDNIIGFVYAKDLLSEIGKKPEDFKLCNRIREAYFVPETKPLRTLLHEFQNQKVHIAVVLDEYGGTAGIVTIEDILEELVGEITDEYEEKPPEPIKKMDDNTIEVDARTYIDDLNDEFEMNLPEEEDYDTIGGFVFSYLGYIPKTDETFDYESLKFTISSAETRRIKLIRIQLLNRD